MGYYFKLIYSEIEKIKFMNADSSDIEYSESCKI